MEQIRLDEVYDTGLSGTGVFYYLQSLDVPWKGLNINTVLDIAYHGNHGERIISPLVKKLLDTNNVLTTENKTKISTVLYNLFKDQWTHKYALLNAEYNPISNYDMREEETPAEITKTITPAETTETLTPAETTQTLTPAETTETASPAETTTETQPAKTITENEISAFNSGSYVDDTKTTITGDSNEKGSQKITVDTAGETKFEVDTAGSSKFEVDTAGTNKLKVDTAGETKLEVDTAGSTKLEVDTAGSNKIEVDEAGSEVITVQNNRVLTRSGNIGVTTTQQMMQSEIELWQWNFFESVFKDIDSILTLSIY